MRLAYIVLLASLLILELGCDSDTPIVMQPTPDPQILIAHNKWRSFVGVPDMEWSEDLAIKALTLLDGSTCNIANNTNCPVGVNRRCSHRDKRYTRLKFLKRSDVITILQGTSD